MHQPRLGRLHGTDNLQTTLEEIEETANQTNIPSMKTKNQNLGNACQPELHHRSWPSLPALLLAVIGFFLAVGGARAQVTIYQDLFDDQQNVNNGGPYTQTLATTVPTVRNAIAGGSASATWLAGVEVNGWGQRDYNNNDVATPTSSNFLPFTPDAGYTYTLQATIDTTAASGWGDSWFTVGFTSSQHNWDGSDSGTIDTAHLVRFNHATTSTITYTLAGSDLVTAGIQYVGWITDFAGYVNLNPNSTQVTIDNFSLTATPVPEPGSMALLGVGGLLMASAGLKRMRGQKN